jgi:hypothetical protein
LIVLYCYEGFSSRGDGNGNGGAAPRAPATPVAPAGSGAQLTVISPRAAPQDQQQHCQPHDTTLLVVDTTQPHIVNVHTDQV